MHVHVYIFLYIYQSYRIKIVGTWRSSNQTSSLNNEETVGGVIEATSC